jgi:hypothetical protein
MIFSLIISAVLSMTAHAQDFPSAVLDLEKVWPRRVEMAKREDQLILSNMQLSSAISRMMILARNTKSNPEQTELTKEIYESTMKIVERYKAMFTANEIELEGIYTSRKRVIDADSLAMIASGFVGCGSLEIPVGSTVRLRLDKFHSHLRKPFEFGLKQREIMLDFVIAVTFHDGNNIFSLPNTQTAYVFFDQTGKTKFMAIGGEYGSCWVDL